MNASDKGRVFGGVRENTPAWLQWPLLLAVLALLCAARAEDTAPIAVGARDPLYDKLWRDPEVEQRIDAGIKLNRMGFATLRFLDAQGSPLTDVEVRFEQTRHEFLFGSTLSMLGRFPTAEQNQKYDGLFPVLFNHAYVTSFMWAALETEQGKPRFEKGSPPPPPVGRMPTDVALEWCRLHDITPKLHLLIWHYFLPIWLPNNRDEVKTLMIKRFEEIAARYGREIKYYDVVDEALHRPPEIVLPNDHVYTAVHEAERAFPPDSDLAVGEHTAVWTDFHLDSSPFYLMLQNLQLRNARFDTIGMQFQFLFANDLGPGGRYSELLAGKLLRPLDLYRVLDQYSDFHRPIHITQVAIPSVGSHGEEDQGVVARNLYRLWFSHPSVEAITWWNFVDGAGTTAANIPVQQRTGPWFDPKFNLNVNLVKAGLLRPDFSPKPSFTALYNLIRKEWWTNVREDSGPNAELKIQGFYGDYKLTATHAGKTVERKIHLTKNGMNDFEVRFP